MVLLSDLSRQLDAQQTVGQGVDEDDEADVVGGGHEVAEGEGLRVLDTLEPGHHHALLPRASASWAPAHLPPGLVAVSLPGGGAAAPLPWRGPRSPPGLGVPGHLSARPQSADSRPWAG